MHILYSTFTTNIILYRYTCTYLNINSHDSVVYDTFDYLLLLYYYRLLMTTI